MAETASPLTGFALFMAGLAIFGCIMAGAQFLAAGPSHPADVQAPHNSISGRSCDEYCVLRCLDIRRSCVAACGADKACQNACEDTAEDCAERCC